MHAGASRHIAAAVRSDDPLALYGGDVFLVILDATNDGRTAHGVLERHPRSHRNGHLRVGTGTGIAFTLSAGVIELQPGHPVADLPHTVDGLVHDAERAKNRMTGDPAPTPTGAQAACPERGWTSPARCTKLARGTHARPAGPWDGRESSASPVGGLSGCS